MPLYVPRNLAYIAGKIVCYSVFIIKRPGWNILFRWYVLAGRKDFEKKNQGRLSFFLSYLDAIFDFDDVGVAHSLDDRRNVGGERLHAPEGGDEGRGQPSLRVHLLPQEHVLRQVGLAEVIVSAMRRMNKPSFKRTVLQLY